MEREKTAVEWLISKLYDYPIDDIVIKRIKEAKQMEKEQIVEAFEDGFVERQFSIESNSKQYYESKYGKDENKAENND